MEEARLLGECDHRGGQKEGGVEINEQDPKPMCWRQSCADMGFAAGRFGGEALRQSTAFVTI